MTPIVTAGSWKQLSIDIPLSGSYNGYLLVIGCSNPSATDAYFDDFRFHPLSELITTNVYEKSTGLTTHTLDENNFYKRNVYDNMYRISSEYKETINGEIKMNDYTYNYGRGN